MAKVILVDAWKGLVDEYGLFQEMRALLDEFENRKIILTNANEEERENHGIVNMPYEVFSLAHNPDKADPEYYKKMLEHFSLTPEDVVYFEHSAEAVESAESVGINTFHYNHEKKDLESLKSFLKENL